MDVNKSYREQTFRKFSKDLPDDSVVQFSPGLADDADSCPVGSKYFFYVFRLCI